MARVDVSAKHGVGNDEEMWYVLGKPRMVQRFVTQLPVDTITLDRRVREGAKVHNRLCSVSRDARERSHNVGHEEQRQILLT